MCSPRTGTRCLSDALVGLDGDEVRLWSRNGRNWRVEFLVITAAVWAVAVARDVLDGEAVAHCLDGLPDFHRLLGDGQATACFYAFDLLWLEAQDVRRLELIGQRRMLQKALKKSIRCCASPSTWSALTARRCSGTPARWASKASSRRSS